MRTTARPPITIIRHPDPDTLAAAVAARLITAVLDAQAERGTARVVLTGGGMGRRSQLAVVSDPAAAAVDWRAVDFFWGDERFLPDGHPDRNETQARSAMLTPLDVPESRIHQMPASDGRWGDDVGAAARAHADELLLFGVPDPTPFDVVMLGVGSDGHVASLFPGSPQTQVTDRAVVAVTSSPKPPPVRISYTIPTLGRGFEVWLVTAGASKAAALSALLARGTDRLPAGRVRGQSRTLLLADTDALGGSATA